MKFEDFKKNYFIEYDLIHEDSYRKLASFNKFQSVCRKFNLIDLCKIGLDTEQGLEGKFYRSIYSCFTKKNYGTAYFEGIYSDEAKLRKYFNSMFFVKSDLYLNNIEPISSEVKEVLIREPMNDERYLEQIYQIIGSFSFIGWGKRSLFNRIFS